MSYPFEMQPRGAATYGHAAINEAMREAGVDLTNYEAKFLITSMLRKHAPKDWTHVFKVLRTRTQPGWFLK